MPHTARSNLSGLNIIYSWLWIGCHNNQYTAPAPPQHSTIKKWCLSQAYCQVQNIYGDGREKDFVHNWEVEILILL
jgi:hypothetical protein